MNIQAVLEQLDGYFARNQHREAEDFLADAIGQAAAEGDFGALLSLLNELIGLCRETCQHDKAAALGEKALALANADAFRGTLAQAATSLNVANACRAAGRLEESLSLYAQTEQIYRAQLNAWDFSFAELYNNVSLLHQERGDFSLAADFLRRALDIALLHRDKVFEQAVSHANLAACLIELGDFPSAEEHTAAALELCRSDC